MSFDVSAAHSRVAEALKAQFDSVVERATVARNSSNELAQKYAQHLFDGGDPREHPPTPSSYGSGQLISQVVGMNLVYYEWNKARGSTNPVSPVQNVSAWQVAEYLHEHVGEPVRLETLRDIFRPGAARKGTPDDVANAVAAAQTDALIARKTKIGAKVAYVLREAKDGEIRANASSYLGFSHEDPPVKSKAAPVG